MPHRHTLGFVSVLFGKVKDSYLIRIKCYSIHLYANDILFFVHFRATHMNSRAAYHTSIKSWFTYELWIMQLNLALDK